MSTLPNSLPVFPLSGALLLPGGTLPLNIFEPRYVAMVEDALAGNKLIGMIQPKADKMPCGTPEVAAIGCAGEITEVEQTDDGRYLILLTGRQRFKVRDEMGSLRGYRRMAVDWLAEEPKPFTVDRKRLIPALKSFLGDRGLNCDWSAAANCPDEKLVTSLSMICPFTPVEQQALLEAPDMAARSELLTTLLEIACPDCAHKH